MNPVRPLEKILIVDDDKDTLQLLSDIIKSEGYEVITAGDGRKPTDKADIKKVNTILICFQILAQYQLISGHFYFWR
ncbi:MAG: hypothetical protein V2A53_08645 [bacterium]